FLLIWVGIVDVATLRKSRPYVIVGCFAVGMVLTAFEIPVATFLLIWVGIVDVATLRKSRPYVIVGCFAVGMVLT
ncbi:twin-arginine translocase subunit TatC, partial [Acinetobacter baumannii]|uniref:twin-arginine translocase subunit TatC n=1 Tax=Acinetobacter baumannii TaxID=470 RepID=UPI00148A9B2F